MVWGFGWLYSKKKEVIKSPPQHQVDKAKRKCRAFQTALENCVKANPSDEGACKNLNLRLVTCYAESFAPKEHEEHRKCYTSLYTSAMVPDMLTGVQRVAGVFKGQGHCGQYEEAMVKALQAKGLYPFVA